MPRTVEITVPSNRTDNLITEIKRIDGVIGLRMQRDISIQPPGDVVTIETTNRSLHSLMQLLDQCGVGQDSSSSISTSQPSSLISSSFVQPITHDVSEATWEEMETVIAKESNMTVNALIVMAISGVLAAIGLSTNALHLVIAAMVIAPGFEPISRIALGAVSGSRAWQRGLSHTVQGYGALFIGAAATTLVLRALGKMPLEGEASYLPAGVLISYWTSITVSSLIVTAAASIAGAVLIAANRSVLTAGVMIALALVPAATITSMALVSGELGLSGQGLVRWVIEVGFVAIFSLLVFAWKHARVQRRKMML